MRVAPRAYVNSGLYGLWEQVEADLARDPGSWEHAEVERLAWGSTVEWGLHELWRYLLTEIAGLFGVQPAYPDIQVTYNHPPRPNVDTLAADQGGIPMGEDEHWFLGTT